VTISDRIYLDCAATTPLRGEAIEAMSEALEAAGFNPSSLHAEGRRARALLDDARDRIARALGAARKEIVFTGSGTEADNLAITGAVRALGRRCHAIGTAIEHHAVLHALDALRDDGCAVTLLHVDARGTIDPSDFEAAIRPDTALASVMYANNEIGTIAPIGDLARIARERGVLFHTDAVQAPGWLPLDVRALGVDLLSISAHKFQGPKGAGVLFVRDGVALAPIVHGGGQEYGRRSGTENLLGIVGMARALELAVAEQPARARRVGALRDRLEAGIVALGGVRVNGAGAPRLPNNCSVSFEGITSEALLVGLDLEGVAVSAGSACTSGVLEASHVIAALHGDPRWHTGVIRFSLGAGTTEAEVERVLSILPRVIAALRGNSSLRP
jgi:cysteine desulfurase